MGGRDDADARAEGRAHPGAPSEPPSVVGDEDMVRLVAELYYLRDLTQSTIADLTGFSVSKVSRMLALARDAGIVRIRVQPAAGQLRRTAEELASALGLRAAHVTAGRSDDPARATRLCGVAAAPWVAERLPERGTLGMAGGYTTAALVDALPPRHCPDLTIVPMVGGWDPATPHLDINELVRRAAGRLGARYQLLHAPGRLDSLEVRDALLAESAIRLTTAYWDRLDTALVGISGGPDAVPGYTTVMERLDSTERRRLAEAGVVGDITGHLFDAEGRFVRDPVGERTVAVPIEALARTPEVIAVAAGPHKVRGIIGASRTGLLHAIVTDQPTADAILRLLGAAAPERGAVGAPA
jgi:DNA-binding transcriptional regulator LsrR (DeoR family)